MKVELTPTITGFKPVSITLTFETQNELDAFGALFNYAPVCEALEHLTEHRIDDDRIRRTVEKAEGSCIRLHSALDKLVKNYLSV
jgi:hypothetical protein